MITSPAETNTFKKDGTLTIEQNVSINEDKPFLPRYGVHLSLKEGFDNIKFFGMGPHEAYEDKCLSTKMGIYSMPVSDNFENYIFPQENSSHVGTMWAELSKPSGHALLFTAPSSMVFRASYYSDETLESTDVCNDLVPDSCAHVYLDYRQSGCGSNSCGPALDEKYRLNEKNFTFTFSVKPVFTNDADPFEELDKN